MFHLQVVVFFRGPAMDDHLVARGRIVEREYVMSAFLDEYSGRNDESSARVVPT